MPTMAEESALALAATVRTGFETLHSAPAQSIARATVRGEERAVNALRHFEVRLSCNS